jgi:hypothetical protein
MRTEKEAQPEKALVVETEAMPIEAEEESASPEARELMDFVWFDCK